MRLKKLILENFRCFSHFEIELDPRLTVLVAENGGGKTAVLDGIAIGLTRAMRYLSSANQRLEGPGIRDIDFKIEAWADRASKKRFGASDYARVELATIDGLRWDHWRPSTAGKEPTNKLGEADLAAYLARINDSFKTDSPELMPVFAYYGARRGHIVVPDRLRSGKENFNHPASALVGALDSLDDFRSMLQWFDLEEASELRINKGRLPEEYEEAPALAAVRAAIHTVLGGDFANPYFNSDHKFVLEPKSGGAPLQISQLSQGYQRMLALGMDFARRMALANSHLDFSDSRSLETIFRTMHDLFASSPLIKTEEARIGNSAPLCAPAIMLVDEIDVHLHPVWQQRVLSDLMRTFPATQFIVTTHSPQVLSTVSREHIRVLTQREDGQHVALMPDFSPLAHEAGDALAKVMGTHPHAPLPLRETVQQFELMVRAGQEQTEEAQALKQQLDAAGYQIHDSDLSLWRLLARRRAQG